MTSSFLPTLAFGLVILSSCSPAQSQPSDTWKFGFGTESAAGVQAVSPDTRYDEKAGFGFEGEAKISGSNGKGALGDGPFFFSAAVPEGNYDVKVTLGDPKVATNTTIKAEARRLMAHQIRTAPGEFKTVAFSVAVKRPRLESGRSLTLKSAQSPLDWDDKLTLEFNGEKPIVSAIEIAPAAKSKTVFLAGDSTVTNQGGEPFVGWGQMLPRFFQSGVAVYNNAESGETLASFAAGNRLQKIWESAKPGDTLLIQFGHNDQKDKNPNALQTYKTNLARYVKEARERELIPVLVMPMERRIWKEDALVLSLGANAAATREVAEAEKVPLIDLNAASVQFINALGNGGSKAAFVHYPAETFPGQTKALRDDSHFNAYGAYELARIVADGIRAQKLDIAPFLTTDLPVFDPSKPDDATLLALPASPMTPIVKPAGN